MNFLQIFQFCFRWHDRLLGQRMLLARKLCRPHHVPIEQRSSGGALEKATSICHSILLPKSQVLDRGEFGAILRAHGRVHGKVRSELFDQPIVSKDLDSVRSKNVVLGLVIRFVSIL